MFQMLVTTIHLCVSPAIIELLNKVMVTVTSNPDSRNEETEKEINYIDLWQQKPLVETDLWYLKTGNLLFINGQNKKSIINLQQLVIVPCCGVPRAL